jgi:HEAT repeat protein
MRGVSLAVDRDARARIAAANEVARLGASALDTIPLLIAMLDQDRMPADAEDLAAAFSSGTATTEDGRMAENLARIAEADLACKVAAQDALAKIGEPAVSALAEALEDPSPNRRSGAAKALGEIGLPADVALPALQRRAKADDAEIVRQAAAEAIKKIKPRRWFSF